MAFAAWAALPSTVEAAPGQALRMAGPEAQGPASRAVTALHHNPAMLAALQATAVQATASGGLDQLRVRRYAIDGATGVPGGSLDSPTSLLNPSGGFFAGASFYFDPVAFGVGYYDLGSMTRLISADPLRYHLAPDPDPGCLNPDLGACPPNGGAVSSWQDLTLALALNRGFIHFGAGVHFPRLRERFAYDDDTELRDLPEGVATARCDDKEDPLCAERVGFKGWTQWIARPGAPAGFDAALTFGVALELARDKVTLGARYRTFPLRRAGRVALGGEGLVCRPDSDTDSQNPDVVPSCDNAKPVRASLTMRIPQQVAIGGSFVLGRSELWRVDTNLYWIDYCAGGLRAGSCAHNGDQQLRLSGLNRNTFVLPELTRHRGLQDVYGMELSVKYRIRSNTAILFGTNASSPSVKRDSQTAAWGEGWRVGLSAGARFRMRATNVTLTPGYGLDVLTPRNVSGSRAVFDPSAATDFVDSGSDLNSAGADAVIYGRARPTNAGRYFGMLHTFSLSLSWGEAPDAFN
jgi:hypothetical protein